MYSYVNDKSMYSNKNEIVSEIGIVHLFLVYYLYEAFSRQ